MKKSTSLLYALLIGPLLVSSSFAQTAYYKCPNCGQLHVQSTSTAVQPASATRVAASVPTAVQSAVVPSAPSYVQPAAAVSMVPQATIASPKRWRFDKANNWVRRIDPNAQAWAQAEANRIAQRGYQGYLQNGHPGGNNPHASVTGTGTTFPGADLIHTCEGDRGMTLVAEAAAVSRDGRIYGVRSWR